MRLDIDLTNFSAGELSPRAKGRIDQSRYFNGCDTELNMVSMPLGGATKRPGTLFVALAKDQNPGLFRVRLMPFVFSQTQSYVHEHSNQNVRVYMNDGVVLNAGNPVDIATPYLTTDLPNLSYTQSADTFYLDSPSYAPATLTRSSHTAWTYAATQYRDGPYLPVNATSTTLLLGAASGTTTLTASSAAGINNGQGFLSSDVGRAVRIFDANNAWCWGTITSFTDSLHVGFTFGAAVANGANGSYGGAIVATAGWQLGKWSQTTGYPFITGFFQQRLFHFGTNNQPNALELSASADFTNMSPTSSAGTVLATNAISWVISDDQVNAVRWASAAGGSGQLYGAQLGIGTASGEDILMAGSTSAALSATSVQTYRESTYGSAPNAGNANGGPVRPLRIGKAVLFVDRSGRKLREWTFQYFAGGYVGPDLLEWSEHITRGQTGTSPASWGIREMAYQQAPYQVIWAVTNDGRLISFTYDGPITSGQYAGSQLVFAPARHQLGGQYYGGPPFVESVCVIPAPDGTYDEVWLCVLRTINGTPTRTIEVMSRYFEAQPLDQAVFVDCALQSPLTFPNATLTPSGFTENELPGVLPQTMPQSFTGTGTLAASAAIFSAANVGSVVRLNGGSLTVTQFVDTQHVTAQVVQPIQNQAPAAANQWSMTPLATTFTGVSYLNGETAAVLADGAFSGTQVVAGGQVTIAKPGASFATIGLPYTPVIVAMPFEPQRAAAAAAQGKVKNLHGLWLRVHESGGFDFGVRSSDDWTKLVTDRVEPFQSRSASDTMGQPPALLSGIRELRPQGAWDREGQLIITQEEPTPLTVLSLFASAEIGELPDAA